MNNNKIENRKAFPKLVKLFLIGGLIGLVVGIFAGYVAENLSAVDLYHNLNKNLYFVAPYAIWLSLIIFSGMAIYNYRKARDIFSKWDGEDDDFIRNADNKLNYAIMYSQINMILSMFLFIISTMGEMESIAHSIISVVGFLLSLAVIIGTQQKVVDLTKEMNPEKQGSVYDPKFQEKWLATCDENELRQIGQASFKAFTITTITCIFLLLASLFISDVLDAGFYPSLLVVIIWLVSSLAYFIECIRLGK